MAGEPTRWARLEPGSRDDGLTPGLEARTHDPLWLLARQWQLGELTADAGAGSAVAADLTVRVAPLTGLRRGSGTEPYDVGATPLEALVEAEDARAAGTARAAARAGQHFERLLAAHGAAGYVPAYRDAYRLGPAADPADAGSRRFLAVLRGRVVDGARLYRDLAAALRPPTGTAALPARPAVAAADRDAVLAAARAWLDWADALVVTPAGGPAGWVPDRLEYAFGLTAADGTALDAGEHDGGRLDWHPFDAGPTTTPAGTVASQLSAVPSAVTYPGMPASRLWEFEDARVDLGAVDAEPADLGRMLLAEFGLVFGADWLVVPLAVPVGSVVRIDRLDVRDTFGRTVRVPPAAGLDGPGAVWGLFGLTAAGTAAAPPGGPLLVAPALAGSLPGPALEEVLLVRDEAANLAWAIERTVEGEDGRPADRARTGYESAPPAPAPGGPADLLAYRLRTDVPGHWLPLLPQRDRPADPSLTFHLGALTRPGPGGGPEPIRPLGRLLRPPAPGADVVLREEEVPREGVRVTRAYQLARWIDGTTHLWLARRKAVGRGEGSSGLRFDTAEPPTQPPAQPPAGPPA
jgi:hypothetical protein